MSTEEHMSNMPPASAVYKDAELSRDRLFRYTLSRSWQTLLEANDEILLFILLNPSTADENLDDPTLRRGMGFAWRLGYGAVVFCNLFAFRTPSPAKLKMAIDPVGPLNDEHILQEAKEAHTVVLAWGTHGTYRDRDKEVLELLGDGALHCLGKTKNGHPRHPLYLPNNTELEEF